MPLFNQSPQEPKALSSTGRLSRLFNRHFRHYGNLAQGLKLLNSELGLTETTSARYVPPEPTQKTPTEELARATIYAPDMDGQADPGEVVWADIRPHRGPEIQRRAVLIIGRNQHTLLTLLISSNEAHREDDNWTSIGPGAWAVNRKESWVRLDKVLEIPESQIMRRGLYMPERRYERIAQKLREDYGWY